MELKAVELSVSEDVKDARAWVDLKYTELFAEYFEGIRTLSSRMKSQIQPISDAELEMALTNLPLDLFEVASKLSDIKLNYEVIKLHNKKEHIEAVKKSTATTVTQRNAEADAATADNRALELVYETLIERVEKEVSYTRELIMTAKKIWDGRRKAEQSVPIGPVDAQSKSQSEYQLPTKHYDQSILSEEGM
jgi:hypothetical protein